MLVKDNRFKADSLLNDFWAGVSETFSKGILKDLEYDSFSVLQEQSPKAFDKFMSIQLSLHNEMTMEQLECSVAQMTKAFETVALRYKGKKKQSTTQTWFDDFPVVEKVQTSGQSEDIFSDEPDVVDVVQKVEIISDEEEDIFA